VCIKGVQMSRKDKLVKSMKNNPKDVDFDDLKKVLLEFGYEVDNTGGSHWVFRKENYEIQVIPRKKPIKAIYVIRALKAIGEWK
jgi:predicted RNA binding protein YcfA (HicA-like mRNA interferase family)